MISIGIKYDRFQKDFVRFQKDFVRFQKDFVRFQKMRAEKTRILV